MAVFVEDPAQSLNELGVSLSCAMDSTRDAVIDFSHRSRVNFENYYFADLEAKARFDAAPITYSGPLTDPVSRVRFWPKPDSPRTEHNGSPYFFQNDSTWALFSATPDSFPVTKARMLPREPAK